MEIKLSFLPKPKEVHFLKGTISLGAFYFNSGKESEQVIRDFFKNHLRKKIIKAEDSKANIIFIVGQDFSKEEYTLEITSKCITITYSQNNGLYYALISLKHIMYQYGEKLPCLFIKDKPDIDTRGVMLDISRDKIPKIETLFHLIDILTDLKINHFQLYIEGFSFAYPSFQHLWKGKETPITIEEIKSLEKYCEDRFVDLVGNQNCLGHMEQWLSQDEFKELAENTESVKIMGVFDSPPTTINPRDPRSLELIEKMFDDILPCFNSTYFNANLDEPILLGFGRSNAIKEGKTAEELYLQHVNWINEIIKNNNKKMLMWGDIVIKDPKLVENLSKDITVMLWGYEADYPFEEHAKILSGCNLDFYICPGTNSWLSLTGRTDNMFDHIRNACVSAQENKAKGIIVTEWGDKGHWQPIPVSYPAYVYSMSLSWNIQNCNEIDIMHYLDEFIFKDTQKKMGKIVLNYGRYNVFEDLPMFNMTLTMSSYSFGLERDIVKELYDRFGTLDKEQEKDSISVSINQRLKNKKKFQYDELITYVNNLDNQLLMVDLTCEDGEQIIKEYKHATKLIVLGATARQFALKHKDMNIDEKNKMLNFMNLLLHEVKDEFLFLWTVRNKVGGLYRSMKELDLIQNELNDQLQK